MKRLVLLAVGRAAQGDHAFLKLIANPRRKGVIEAALWTLDSDGSRVFGHVDLFEKGDGRIAYAGHDDWKNELLVLVAFDYRITGLLDYQTCARSSPPIFSFFARVQVMSPFEVESILMPSPLSTRGVSFDPT